MGGGPCIKEWEEAPCIKEWAEAPWIKEWAEALVLRSGRRPLVLRSGRRLHSANIRAWYAHNSLAFCGYFAHTTAAYAQKHWSQLSKSGTSLQWVLSACPLSPTAALPPHQDQERVRTSAEGLPFVLSEALPVVPGRLVQRIQRGDYVEMAELLKDNVEEESCSGR